MDKAIALKNEALELIAAGNGASDRMDEILSEIMAIIQSGTSVAVARAALNRVASAL